MFELLSRSVFAARGVAFSRFRAFVVFIVYFIVVIFCVGFVVIVFVYVCCYCVLLVFFWLWLCDVEFVAFRDFVVDDDFDDDDFDASLCDFVFILFYCCGLKFVKD